MDRKSSLTLRPCCHGSESEMMLMMESMRSQQELLMQLRALVLPLLHGVHDASADIAAQLFDDVIGCNVSGASKLEGCLIMSTTGDDDDGPAVELVVDDKSKSSLARKRNSTITGDRTTDRIRNKPSLIIALVKREGTVCNYICRCALMHQYELFPSCFAHNLQIYVTSIGNNTNIN